MKLQFGAHTPPMDRLWFDKIPKVELHIHLEGAIPYETLWSLVEKYGGDATISTLDALKDKFVFRDFSHFIETWVWKNSFLREYEDFAFTAQAVARDLALQNIRYAEMFFSPPDFHKYGLQTQALAQAIRKGLDGVPEIQIALIADLVRDFGPNKAAVTLEEVYEAREFGIIGVGIGGSEVDYPPSPFAEVFAKARKLGFRTSAHAGEAAGAESVWGAVADLQVDRIGHGTHATNDDVLLDYLAQHQIPIELCPISNLKTRVIDSIQQHPIRQFIERGIPVSVNTDDPKMFGNSLADEYRLLVEQLDFSQDDIRSLISQGIQSSWQTDEQKTNMISDFENDPHW